MSLSLLPFSDLKFTSFTFPAGSEESDADLPPDGDLFCPACSKIFKTANA